MGGNRAPPGMVPVCKKKKIKNGVLHQKLLNSLRAYPALSLQKDLEIPAGQHDEDMSMVRGSASRTNELKWKFLTQFSAMIIVIAFVQITDLSSSDQVEHSLVIHLIKPFHCL